MRTGHVLSLPPLCVTDKTSGTRCVSGVPPARQNVSSGTARHPRACYSFATVLLSICYHRGLPVCRLLPFCYSFAIELLPLPFCVPSPRHVSDVYIAEPQGCPFRIPVIAARCPSALNRPPLVCVQPCHSAWPTPHGCTVNCATVRRYRGS